MGLSVGVVGLPNVGKSTIFNALTSLEAGSANYPFCTIEPNVGIVEVPDARLERIQDRIATQKVIPAVVEIVDIAGLVKGASKGQGLGNKFLANIRETDAILMVVRCFEDSDVIHVEGSVDPLRDIEIVDIELVLADLESMEKRLKKAQSAAKTGKSEAKVELALLEKLHAHLADGKPARSLALSGEDTKVLRGFQLLTAKPVLYCCNVDESSVAGGNEHTEKVRALAAGQEARVVLVCGKLEEELSGLDDADKRELLESYGLEEPALHVLVRECYQLLGLQSYFTAGEKEIRAWTVPVGASAPRAAAAIHTDFEKGFIRAQVYTLADLEKHGSEAAVKTAGKLRSEGKDYIVQDGDIMHFLFNV